MKAALTACIVSNHGGRQLDGTIAPLRALPGVVSEAGNMAVMMDSGVRRGTDVLKALALGAHFVFIGRPFLYAASIGGEDGVRHAVGAAARRDLPQHGDARHQQPVRNEAGFSGAVTQ